MSPGNHPFLRELQEAVVQQFPLSTPDAVSYNQLRELLSLHLQHLMDRDFNGLVSLLYRIDVSEQRLRRLLCDHPEKDAAGLLADLILERLEQKIKTRRQTGRRDHDISDEERW